MNVLEAREKAEGIVYCNYRRSDIEEQCAQRGITGKNRSALEQKLISAMTSELVSEREFIKLADGSILYGDASTERLWRRLKYLEEWDGNEGCTKSELLEIEHIRKILIERSTPEAAKEGSNNG